MGPTRSCRRDQQQTNGKRRVEIRMQHRISHAEKQIIMIKASAALSTCAVACGAGHHSNGGGTASVLSTQKERENPNQSSPTIAT